MNRRRSHPAAAAAPALRRTTFALLRERSRLPVYLPQADRYYVISLRGWEDVLWGVRLQPCDQHRLPKNHPRFIHEDEHVLIPRERIEELLGKLVLLE